MDLKGIKYMLLGITIILINCYFVIAANTNTGNINLILLLASILLVLNGFFRKN